MTGLTNRLFNAVGTNTGNPFVYYSAPLAAGQSVGLLLQYYPDAFAFPFTNAQLNAFAVPARRLFRAATGRVAQSSSAALSSCRTAIC